MRIIDVTPEWFINTCKNLGYDDEFINRLEQSFVKHEFPREDYETNKQLLEQLEYGKGVFNNENN